MPKQNYLLDACAVLAFLNGEKGADIVKELFAKASHNEIILSINSANLIEVYYDRIRKVGAAEADEIIREIYDTFPVFVIETLNQDIVYEAAYFKTAEKMSFADSILVATAKCTNAIVITCDHVELKPVEQQGQISFLWIRPQF